MNATETCPILPAGDPDATLRELQLCVARRADELARRGAAPRAADRVLWRRAEWEIFERLERARPLGLGADAARRVAEVL